MIPKSNKFTKIGSKTFKLAEKADIKSETLIVTPKVQLASTKHTRLHLIIKTHLTCRFKTVQFPLQSIITQPLVKTFKKFKK